MRKFFPDYCIITLKGMAMGAADVVPGVSGGTIAFISGIYQELIDSINRVDHSVFSRWKKEGLRDTWKYYNGTFLLSLGLGIIISFLSLAKLITYLLKNEPIAVWSFFFGLVAASILFIGKQISGWNIKPILALLLGAGISYYITIAEPVASPDSLHYIFLSGFIAIIAMILPGVSGSFILLLMGSYEIMMSTINQLREGIVNAHWDHISQSFIRIIVFATGAIIGLKLFSKILHWMFDRYKNITLAVLVGFMIGSLNKIWPWKEIVTTRINSKGEEVPLLEKSIFPVSFDGDPQLITALVLMIFGFLTIFILEKTAAKYS